MRLRLLVVAIMTAGALLAAVLMAKEPAVNGMQKVDKGTTQKWHPGKPYLNMPETPDGTPPQLLSQVGAFLDVTTLSPGESLLPYDINAPFWSDGAAKLRWISVPETTTGPPVMYQPKGNWNFPDGTVFVKHFELPSADANSPPVRIETRILVRSRGGGVHGATYRWRDDQKDAELVAEGSAATVATEDRRPGQAGHPWYFPGVNDCQICHTAISGGVLGVNARQMNRSQLTGDGSDAQANQLVAWTVNGLLMPGVKAQDLASIDKLAAVDDQSAPLDHRAKTYLDVNCAMCHQPGGNAGYFDARFETALAAQNLINGSVMINMGIDSAKVVAPHDPWRSILLNRMSTLDAGIKMPPLGHETIDEAGLQLMRDWVMSMPGPDVLPPPALTAMDDPASRYPTVMITHSDPTALIRYTTNGAPPGEKSPVYTEPLVTSGPVTIRARAFKPGATKSIVATETYLPDQD